MRKIIVLALAITLGILTAPTDAKAQAATQQAQQGSCGTQCGLQWSWWTNDFYFQCFGGTDAYQACNTADANSTCRHSRCYAARIDDGSAPLFLVAICDTETQVAFGILKPVDSTEGLIELSLN